MKLTNLIKQFNALDGKTVTRKVISKLHTLLFDNLPQEKDQIKEMWEKLGNLLSKYPNAESFELSLKHKINEVAGLTKPKDISDMLNGVPFENESEVCTHGLGKPVTSEQIYDMITKKIIKAIQGKTNFIWRKPWQSEHYGITATNYVSKKAYRGINAVLLNMFSEGRSPYWLTFKQVNKLKGKVKKGTHGEEVIYFSFVHTISQETPKLNFSSPDAKKFNKFIKDNAGRINGTAKKYKIPVLKYYHVYNADDIEGIKFKMPVFKKPTEHQRIEVSEKIVKLMPNRPKLHLEDNGDNAFYRPSADSVTMPKLSFFENAQFYYSVFFHELIHSTKHEKRLNDSTRKSWINGRKDKKKYAFEELIAELGAVFLCAESGTLYHTLNNSTSYLKGWSSALVSSMKKDNKFFFRASSKAQAGADFILDRDKNGTPKYLRSKIATNKKTTPVKKKPTILVAKKNTRTKTVRKKPTKQLALFGGKKRTTRKRTTLKKVVAVKGALNKGTSAPAPQKTGLQSVAHRPKITNQRNYTITGDIAELLGNVEIKPINSVAITLDAPQGAGKTRFFFQAIDKFASKGYKVLFVSCEEHPQSRLFQDKLDQYVASENQHNVFAIDTTNFDEISGLIPQFDIIFIDSWSKIAEKNGGVDFDNDLRKKFDSKLFFAIFQRTTQGTMRGGAKSQFDGDIILKVVREDDFKQNYVVADKNRYQDKPINELMYNIYDQRLMTIEVQPEPSKEPTPPAVEEEPVVYGGKVYI